MATREDAGSVLSLTRIATSSSNDAVGLADATAKILSVKTVLLLGVARWRPPRRSPGFEPLGMLLQFAPYRPIGLSAAPSEPTRSALVLSPATRIANISDPVPALQIGC